MLNKIFKALGALTLVGLLIAAGPGVYTGSIVVPSTGTFTTSAALNSAAGNNLILNAGAGANVLFNYGNSRGAGISIYDGEPLFAELYTGGLVWSGTGTSYTPTGEYLR